MNKISISSVASSTLLTKKLREHSKLFLSLLLPALFIIFSVPTVVAQNGFMDFDASDDHIQIPPTVQDDFTIEFWLNSTQSTWLTPTYNSGFPWYLGSGLVDAEVPGATNDFGLSFFHGRVLFGTGGENAAAYTFNRDFTIHSTSVLNDGQWHHVAATRTMSTGTMSLYIDGVLEATRVNASTESLTAPSNITIGELQTHLGSSWAWYEGQIDEVRIWNTVRSLSEIQDNMVNELLGDEPGLEAYYRFNEIACGNANPGFVADDAPSGGSQIGTMTNMQNLAGGCSSNFSCAEAPCFAALPLILAPPPPPPPLPIPTTSEWGLVFLILIFGSGALVRIVKNEQQKMLA